MTAIHSQDPALLWTAAGAFTGVVLMPDLDNDGVTISEFFMSGFGYWAQRIWYYYWYPYRKLMSHRSFWSHFPIVGTVIRVAYLFWWVYLLGWSLPPAFLNGLVAVDAVHYFMDQRMFRRIFAQ